MLTTVMKNNTTLRKLLLLCVTVLTSTMLVIGIHISGISPISSAHAAEVGKTVMKGHLQTPCASDPTGARCNNQDPIVQSCDRDAQTLSYVEIRNKQGLLLATVQRRYSPTCRSEWGRVLKSPNYHQSIGITIADHDIRWSSGAVVFSTMVFVPNLSIASEIIGNISTDGGAVFLPALPEPLK